jgi:hypothetical protein
MLDHWRSYGNATSDSSWGTVIDSVYSLIATMQSQYAPSTGLLPDFIINTTATPAPPNGKFIEGNNDGDYFYNSCRVPWRITTDYLVSSDARAKAAVQKMNAWIMSATGNNPGAILDGYTLDGGKAPGQTGPSSAFTSPFGVSALLGTDQAWLDAIWSSRQINQDYYADSITMLSMIVMSGNWWAP